MMVFLYFVILLSVITTTCGSIQACGTELTSLLSLVCNNQFHSPVKRISESDLPQLAKRSEDIIKRNSVVDECCISSCTFDHLQLYCRFPDEEVKGTTTSSSTTKKTTTTTTTTTTPSPAEAATIRVPWMSGRRWFFVNRIGRFMSRARRVFNMK